MVLDSCCVSVVSETWNKFELADSVLFVNCLQTWLQGFSATHSGINNSITNRNLIIASDSYKQSIRVTMFQASKFDTSSEAQNIKMNRTDTPPANIDTSWMTWLHTVKIIIKSSGRTLLSLYHIRLIQHPFQSKYQPSRGTWYECYIYVRSQSTVMFDYFDQWHLAHVIVLSAK